MTKLRSVFMKIPPARTPHNQMLQFPLPIRPGSRSGLEEIGNPTALGLFENAIFSFPDATSEDVVTVANTTEVREPRPVPRRLQVRTACKGSNNRCWQRLYVCLAWIDATALHAGRVQVAHCGREITEHVFLQKAL